MDNFFVKPDILCPACSHKCEISFETVVIDYTEYTCNNILCPFFFTEQDEYVFKTILCVNKKLNHIQFMTITTTNFFLDFNFDNNVISIYDKDGKYIFNTPIDFINLSTDNSILKLENKINNLLPFV